MDKDDITLIMLPDPLAPVPDWLTRWERAYPLTQRIDAPTPIHSRDWLHALHRRLHTLPGKKLIIAHGLACYAAVLWHASLSVRESLSIQGLFLVTPPDLAHFPVTDSGSLSAFLALTHRHLHLPATLIGSQNHPMCSIEHTQQLAESWHCLFINGGDIHAANRLGNWSAGQKWLQRVMLMA